MNKRNRVFLRDDGVIEIQVIGDQTVDSVQAMGDAAGELAERLRRTQKPVLVLDNLLQIGTVPQDARARVVHLAKHMPYDRLAMLGKRGVLELGANLMLRATGKGNTVHFFTGEDEALIWLNR